MSPITINDLSWVDGTTGLNSTASHPQSNSTITVTFSPTHGIDDPMFRFTVIHNGRISIQTAYEYQSREDAKLKAVSYLNQNVLSLLKDPSAD